MPKIFLSPSNQFANAYAYGGTNEGKQMGIVAQLLKTSLERCGFSVYLMHDESMATKVAKADSWGADLYVPIHSNACNKEVAGTRMFCWSKPGKGYDACLAIFNFLAPLTPGTSESIKVDQTLYEIKNPAAPVAYIEVDFHDVESVAKWIIEHTADIAEAICKGICKYFGITYKAPNTTTPTVTSCTVSVPNLKNGSSGASVKVAQALLNLKNNAGLSVDGSFGSLTEKAVVAYQKKLKITQSKTIDKATWTALLH